MGIRVLVLDAGGYVGSNLVPALRDVGMDVCAASRNSQALESRHWQGVELAQVDAQVPSTLAAAMKSVDVALYLVPPLRSDKGFDWQGASAARRFAQAAERAGVGRIIYLGGMLSSDLHPAQLRSRVAVGDALRAGSVPVIELRAGIIFGPGSVAFQVLRGLVNHLPVIVTPRWFRVPSSPIALDNVVHYLLQLALAELPEPAIYEIAGPEVLTYEDMMRIYAARVGKRMRLIPTPLRLPKLSCWWLRRVAQVPKPMVSSLIDGLQHSLVASDQSIRARFPQHLHGFAESLDVVAQAEPGREPLSLVAEPLRNQALPPDMIAQSTVLGLPDLRHWSDGKPGGFDSEASLSREELGRRYSGIIGKQHHYLALSGGGENGAFAAGLLAGWTASDTRPEFTVVTGISTGALIAPFAFLGSEYDQAIKEVYTGYAMEDLVEKRSARFFTRNDALTDSTPLQGIIARYMNQDVVDKIAAADRLGRGLLIGTTHLDAGRPMMWDIGAIAASGRPGALELIRKIMLASASIPVGLPPVIIQVEADGQAFDEMHVDGGVTSQVFLYPVQLDWNAFINRLELPAPPRVYVVRNGYLAPNWESMEEKIIPIAKRTISSLIRTQGIGDLFRMYATTQRDGLDFNLAYIPEDFSKNEQRRGIGYMKNLYHFAFTAAKDGYPWEKAPPGFDD